MGRRQMPLATSLTLPHWISWRGLEDEPGVLTWTHGREKIRFTASRRTLLCPGENVIRVSCGPGTSLVRQSYTDYLHTPTRSCEGMILCSSIETICLCSFIPLIP